MSGIKVLKRNGEKEDLNYEKINKVLLWAVEGINGVSASDVAMNAHLQLFDGITSTQIHKVLISSAADMITEDSPNYQFVASKLLNYLLRKEIFNTYNNFPRLKQFIKRNIKRGVYDSEILDSYSDYDIDKIEGYIKHQRDEELTYAGLQQLVDKYMVKDRKTGVVYETPQFMYMLIAMTLFAKKEGKDRLRMIKTFYDLISTHKISLPTPIVAGVRTPNRQYSSCVLIDVDDDLDSIFNSNTAVGKYISKRAGIGMNFRLRGIGSTIRNGEVVHTGIIPFLKMFEGTVKSCSQGGIRGGAATAYYPFWHLEVEDIIVLKNNRGNELNRVRRMDHAIQLSRLFYKRFVNNEKISLFSPSDVPGLYEAFGRNDEFDPLYEKYEKDESIPRREVSARELMDLLIQERIETGRIYIMNIDNANDHSAFLDKINMSNLCTEINLPTTPLKHIDDGDDTDAEIALCVLAALNLGTVNNLDDLEVICEYIVRGLDFVISHQDYPINAAKKMLKRRSIGVGVTNFAYWMVKNGLRYDDPESLKKVDELFEHIQYYLIKASVQLAKEEGACEWFDRTKYSQGLLPIDHYNKNVDKLVERELTLDWESLRKDVLEYGMRNSTLTAQMPCESSSVVSSSTNGIEPPRKLITVKKSKSGAPLPVVVPEMQKYKNKYEFAWSFDNGSMNNIVSIVQKYFDQGISVNHYYDKRKYDDGNLPISEVAKDILNFYKFGGKQIYYANSKDYKSDRLEDMISSYESKEDEKAIEFDDEVGCEGGACAI
jgi:ribonucleoside-diphosphate reductase alpha chain